MPVSIRRKGRCYQVRTPNRVHARCTSRKNAKAQERILNAVEHNPNWRPTGRRARRSRR